MKLLDNGLDSFKKSILLIQKIDQVPPSEYEFHMKDTVFSFHHSIETLFKYTLTTINEYFVYEDFSAFCKELINNSFNAKNKQLSPNTVVFIEAIDRVVVLTKLNISKSQYDSLQILNKIRNAITHHEFDFQDRLAEHLIAKMLPFLYEVFDRNIPAFKQFCKLNKVDSTIDIISKTNDIWAFVTCASYLNKIELSQSRIAYLDKNPTEKAPIFDQINHLRSNKIELEKCPLCATEAFARYGTSILYLEEKSYYGKCHYCGLDQSKQESQLLSYYFGTHDDFLASNEVFLCRKIKSIFEYDKKNLKPHLPQIRDSYKLMKETVNRVINMLFIEIIVDLMQQKAESYFENKIGCDSEYGDEMVNTPGNMLEVNYEIDDLSEHTSLIQEFIKQYKGVFGIRKDILIWDKQITEEFYFAFPFYDVNQDENIDGDCEMTVEYYLNKDQFEL